MPGIVLEAEINTGEKIPQGASVLVRKHILKQAHKCRILFPMISVKQNIEMGRECYMHRQRPEKKWTKRFMLIISG